MNKEKDKFSKNNSDVDPNHSGPDSVELKNIKKNQKLKEKEEISEDNNIETNNENTNLESTEDQSKEEEKSATTSWRF